MVNIMFSTVAFWTSNLQSDSIQGQSWLKDSAWAAGEMPLKQPVNNLPTHPSPGLPSPQPPSPLNSGNLVPTSPERAEFQYRADILLCENMLVPFHAIVGR